MAFTINEINKKRFVNGTVNGIVSFLRFVLLLGLSFVILYPLLYMLAITFREPKELLDLTVVWISKTFTLNNIKEVIRVIDYPKSFAITVAISLVCSVFQSFTAALTGYGFARFKFKGRNILFFAAIFTIMVPSQIIMMPTYINFVNFTEFSGLPTINTIIPLALPALFGSGIRAGLFIAIFRQFFKNMPLELEDAAYMDGCGPMKAYWSVIYPNSGSMTLVTFLFSFVWYWNDYFNVCLYFTEARPLSVRLVTLQDFLTTALSPAGVHYTGEEVRVLTQAASLLFIIPVLIMYIFLQKKFTESIVRAGIVG